MRDKGQILSRHLYYNKDKYESNDQRNFFLQNNDPRKNPDIIVVLYIILIVLLLIKHKKLDFLR